MQILNQYVAELRSRFTQPNTPSKALTDAVLQWAFQWGNTNPDWTHRDLSISQVVDFGQGQTGLRHLRSFSVKMHRANRYDPAEIVEIKDRDGFLVAANPDFRNLECAFDKYFALCPI